MYAILNHKEGGQVMPSYRKLPDDDKLRKLACEGRTTREIAEMYGVSYEAVRQHLISLGVRPQRLPGKIVHEQYVPWRHMNSAHQRHILIRRLRDYSRRQQGKTLSVTNERLLDEWIEYMDGNNPWGVPLSVHYSRQDPEGFWTEPRREGDRDYIHPPSE